MFSFRGGTMIINTPDELSDYVAEAVVRLGYLFPDLIFKICDSGIQVEGAVSDETKLRRDVLYAVYRQKTFITTLPLRTSLVQLLAGR